MYEVDKTSYFKSTKVECEKIDLPNKMVAFKYVKTSLINEEVDSVVTTQGIAHLSSYSDRIKRNDVPNSLDFEIMDKTMLDVLAEACISVSCVGGVCFNEDSCNRFFDKRLASCKKFKINIFDSLMSGEVDIADIYRLVDFDKHGVTGYSHRDPQLIYVNFKTGKVAKMMMELVIDTSGYNKKDLVEHIIECKDVRIMKNSFELMPSSTSIEEIVARLDRGSNASKYLELKVKIRGEYEEVFENVVEAELKDNTSLAVLKFSECVLDNDMLDIEKFKKKSFMEKIGLGS